MRRLLAYLGVAAVAAFAGRASAIEPVPLEFESFGERSPVLSCFYECKPLFPAVTFLPFLWKEVTTVMLANPGVNDAFALVVVLDDDQNIVAVTDIHLSPDDLDELYVCRSLFAGGVTPVPKAGLIEIVVRDAAGDPAAGVYGWVKDLVGFFSAFQPEPFKGNQRVSGIGKTQCRVAPPSVTTPEDIEAKVDAAGPPEIRALLIEGTDDGPSNATAP